MPGKRIRNSAKNTITVIALLTLLTACEYISNPLEENETTSAVPIPTFTLAISSYVGSLPWQLAEEEGLYKTLKQDYQVDIRVIVEDHPQNIEKFISDEKVHAIAITNIDAITRLVAIKNIGVDVILITGYSHGHDAILLKNGSPQNLRDKTLALVEYSPGHYLLDRYLMSEHIAFEEVSLRPVKKSAGIPEMFTDDEIDGVVTANPYKDLLIQDYQAQVLFDSRQIPKEIVDLIIIRRDIHENYPQFAQALLATWFAMMEKLQGNNRTVALDAMAKMLNTSRDDVSLHLQQINFFDTPTRALAALRDRSLQKTMRFIKYFAERHSLTGDVPYDRWVSYPGRAPGLIHFNAKPLQDFLALPKE
ncbi:MAG: hypothetical protein BWK78_05420 [Thiotrichaceae bacterium IS1]|nr:MAG: hypothetical protein BWK78_05420 [Thiotrichaceae bacterium IS1]